jgi:DNA-binding NarL/FixJ family response regulator
VVRLLAEGCSNAEIATRLEMSYYTARNHTEQVLGKLGVSSRAAVGALLYGQG